MHAYKSLHWRRANTSIARVPNWYVVNEKNRIRAYIVVGLIYRNIFLLLLFSIRTSMADLKIMYSSLHLFTEFTCGKIIKNTFLRQYLKIVQIPCIQFVTHRN